MAVRLSDRDRLLAVGCLLRDLVSEESLATAVASIAPPARSVSLAEALVRLGLIDPAEVKSFEECVSLLIAGPPPLEFRRIADQQVARVIARISIPSLRQALLPEALNDEARRFAKVGFRLIRVIGEGGLGRVWLATDEQLQRELAVKELRPDRANIPGLRDRFLREAMISAQLQHPNIASCYVVGGGSPDGNTFLAMELVAGKTLQETVDLEFSTHHDRSSRRHWLREHLAVLLKVCDAVAYAHSRGVVHRDLKPANVMIGRFGEVFVLDWGLAKQQWTDGPESESAKIAMFDDGIAKPPVSEPLTEQGRILGSIPFMAPEQASGDVAAVGVAADIYGLGSVLFTMLTGKWPHVLPEGATVSDYVHFIASRRPPAAIECEPLISPPLNAVCLKAMAREPQDRYASVQDFADDVRQWLAGEPVSAYREPLTQKIARSLIDRPKIFRPMLGFAVGAVVILTAVLFFSVFEVQTRSERAVHNLTAAADLIVGRINIQAAGLRTATHSLADALRGIESTPGSGANRSELIHRQLQVFLEHNPDALHADVFAPDKPELVATIARRDAASRKAATGDLELPKIPAGLGAPFSGKVRVELKTAANAANETTVVLSAATTANTHPDDGGSGVRIVVEFDFGPSLQAVIEPVMKETGISAYVTDERGEIIVRGDFISNAMTQVGRLGAFAATNPDIDHFLRDSASKPVGVFVNSGRDGNIAVAQKAPWNPPEPLPMLGIVLVVSRQQFIAVPLQAILWMALAVAAVLAVAATLGLLTLRAVVRLARHA